MSSRAAAGRKRLQQPKPGKTSSLKSTFIKTFTSDSKSPALFPECEPTAIPTPEQAPFRQPDRSNSEDLGLAVPPTWSPQARSVSPYQVRRPSESGQNGFGTPSSSFHPMPYSSPESREDTHFLSPAFSYMGHHPKAVLSEGLTRDPLLEFGSRYDSEPVSMVSLSGSLYSDSLSPRLSLSPASTDPSLPQLIYSNSSSSIGSSDTNLPSSIVVNPSSSSSSSGSSESNRLRSQPQKPGFVYPGSRSLGRPSPGGPKLRFKSRKKGTELDNGVRAEEGSYSQKPHISRLATQLPNGRISIAGPSSISAPSIRSSRSLNSSTSSGGSIKRSDPGFVFPTTRSRAHPGAAPRTKKKKQEQADADVEVTQKFMGITFNRKKKKTPAIPESPSDDAAIEDDYRDLDIATPTVDGRFETPSPTEHIHPTSVPRAPPRLGTYPFDPYDSALLENDKCTHSLLRRLSSNNTPSFCNYGNDPPSSVLDLGCGQGHWILEAAVHWKGYGTQITGFDLADTMKSIRPLATKNGVAQNIKFVRGNFLKQPLPFGNESFDLVRMANLTYAISYDKWDFVLGEVNRVLKIGGRLEFVDDHIFFPAAIPPSTLSTNGSQRVQEQGDAGDSYDMYGAWEDDGEASDTATLRRGRPGPSPRAVTARHATTSPSVHIPVPDVDYQFWTEQMDASRELEMLFEQTMTLSFGIHLCPSEFMLDMLSQIFGHSREVTTIHLTIAPPESQLIAGTDASPVDSKAGAARSNTNVFGSPLSSAGASTEDSCNVYDLLNASPGLLMWPSTLIPLSHSELQVHALKHPRTLLSCKAALFEHAMESSDIETEDDMFREAVWDYEGFLNSRLSPPPQRAEGLSMPSPTSYSSESDRPLNPSRASLYSVSSVTSEARSAMWEYDFELRHHFAWPLDSPGGDEPVTPTSERSAAPIPEPHEPLNGRAGYRNEFSETETSLPSFSSVTQPTLRTTRRESSAPPDYSETDPVHVRTFHIYEAIKLNPSHI